jgi:methionyl aminopeptidase
MSSLNSVTLWFKLNHFPLCPQLAREVLDIVASHVKPGITTDELDRICHEECIKRDSYPSPLNYVCFPKSVCT